MIKLELRTDGDLELWQGGGLQHYGSLESCGRYIALVISKSQKSEKINNTVVIIKLQKTFSSAFIASQ